MTHPRPNTRRHALDAWEEEMISLPTSRLNWGGICGFCCCALSFFAFVWLAYQVGKFIGQHMAWWLS